MLLLSAQWTECPGTERPGTERPGTERPETECPGGPSAQWTECPGDRAPRRLSAQETERPGLICLSVIKIFQKIFEV